MGWGLGGGGLFSGCSTEFQFCRMKSFVDWLHNGADILTLWNCTIKVVKIVTWILHTFYDS